MRSPTDNFSDAGETYYTGYLAAAKRLGISAGVGDNMYAPGKEITRQEMFTLLYNTLKIIGRLPQGDSGKTLLDFSDASEIASWAEEAMSYSRRDRHSRRLRRQDSLRPAQRPALRWRRRFTTCWESNEQPNTRNQIPRTEYPELNTENRIQRIQARHCQSDNASSGLSDVTIVERNEGKPFGKKSASIPSLS
ncbi:MAG: S-layer homology domain-containing protein [Bacillota bacterium]